MNPKISGSRIPAMTSSFIFLANQSPEEIVKGYKYVKPSQTLHWSIPRHIGVPEHT